MSCDIRKDEIQSFIDGELPDEDVAALREHCMHCPDCADYLREMLKLQEAVQSLADEPVPGGLHSKIMTAYRREKRGIMPWLRRNPALAAAAAVVLLVGTVLGASLGSAMGGASSAPAMELAKIDEDSTQDQENVMSYSLKTTVAGATAAGALPQTTAAQTTAGAVQTTAATMAAADTAAGVSTDPKETGAEDVSEELRALREEAEKMIPELPVTEPYAFVSVVKTETIPLEFEESAMYADQEYNNELVTILCAIVSKEREEEILGEMLIHSSYYCDDPEVYPKLTADAENGLLILIVPQGA
ncbi:MAG: zf-HC2 domain-containing protein [Eubacteriales bacterium]|nr:zf-HC2 domain-containing protein [Eubacteriales bacterium]